MVKGKKSGSGSGSVSPPVWDLVEGDHDDDV